MKRYLLRVIAALSMAAFPGASTYSSDDPNPAVEQPRNCVSITRIRRIEIVDNQTLIFHLNQNTRYINRLPYKCPGLKKSATILHETSLSTYCDLDTISIIDTSIGMRLGSCPLGKFMVYSEPDTKGE